MDQVMSPMSGNVIGSREIRVSSDKVDVTGLSVQVISGLTLNILPDVDLESCYHAHVDISEMLHSKYQVGGWIPPHPITASFIG